MKKANWSGRFNEPVTELVKRFTASIVFDHKLGLHDIEGSLAHAEMLAAQKIITQKDLMVQPNIPRFFRENDRITLITKIANLSDNQLTGNAELKLFDALTEQDISDNGIRKQFHEMGCCLSTGLQTLCAELIEERN